MPIASVSIGCEWDEVDGERSVFVLEKEFEKLSNPVVFLVKYFGTLPMGRLILWCYLCWYLAVVGMHFDGAPRLWLSSLGMSGIIGFALLLSTRDVKPGAKQEGAAAGQGGKKQDGWTVFRLFLMPFCVSSYAALIKGKPFFMIFPLCPKELMVACGACVGFVLWHRVCRFLWNRMAPAEG